MKFALVSLAVLAATATLAVCEETEYIPEGVMRPSETLAFLNKQLLKRSFSEDKKTVAESEDIGELINFSYHDVWRCNEKFFKQLHEAEIKYLDQYHIWYYLFEHQRVQEVVCKEKIANEIREAVKKIPAEDKTMLEKLQQEVDKAEVESRGCFDTSTCLADGVRRYLVAQELERSKSLAEKVYFKKFMDWANRSNEHIAPWCKQVNEILKPFEYTGGNWFNKSLLGKEVEQYLKYWENCKQIQFRPLQSAADAQQRMQ